MRERIFGRLSTANVPVSPEMIVLLDAVRGHSDRNTLRYVYFAS